MSVYCVHGNVHIILWVSEKNKRCTKKLNYCLCQEGLVSKINSIFIQGHHWLGKYWQNYFVALTSLVSNAAVSGLVRIDPWSGLPLADCFPAIVVRCLGTGVPPFWRNPLLWLLVGEGKLGLLYEGISVTVTLKLHIQYILLDIFDTFEMFIWPLCSNHCVKKYPS